MNGQVHVPVIDLGQRAEMEQAAHRQIHLGLMSQVLPIVAGAHYGRWARGEDVDWKTGDEKGLKPDPQAIANEVQEIAVAVLKKIGIVVSPGDRA